MNTERDAPCTLACAALRNEVEIANVDGTETNRANRDTVLVEKLEKSLQRAQGRRVDANATLLADLDARLGEVRR